MKLGIGINMEDYDIEFGPNKVDTCTHCHVRLLPDESCWCLNKQEEVSDE